MPTHGIHASAQQALPRAFFQRAAPDVARDLLGCHVVRRWRGVDLVARIVECEAYLPVNDAACHASRGRTPRNDPLYGPPGHAYVYFIYGMYDMLNVVCEDVGTPAAVLLRAAEPLQEAERMRRWRGVRHLHQVANGPGKLCRALRVSRTLNRQNLQRPPLWIAPGALARHESIATSARIGVDYAGADAHLPLRYFIRDHPHVSRQVSFRQR